MYFSLSSHCRHHDKIRIVVINRQHNAAQLRPGGGISTHDLQLGLLAAAIGEQSQRRVAQVSPAVECDPVDLHRKLTHFAA